MSLSRRSLLRGLGGALLALPALEALATPTTRAPRLLVYYLPNGRRPEWWVPADAGGLTFPVQSDALQPFADRMLSLVDLDNVAARNSPGAAHAAGTSTVMTGVAIGSLPSVVGQLGPTLDQIVAAHHGTDSRFPSLQWSAGEPGPCDVGGANCAYTQSISWAAAGQPLVPAIDPRAAFDRLFGVRSPVLGSVLDAVRDDAHDLERRLGAADQARLDQYFTAVRTLEQTLDASTATCAATPTAPGASLSYPDRVAAFHDLITLAFQCDQTRVLSFMIEFGLSGRAHSFLSSTGGHHALSHYRNTLELAELRSIETWQAQQLGALLQRLSTTPDASGGTLLDDTVVLAMPSMGEGSSHDHARVCPLIVSGSPCLQADGRQLRYSSQTDLGSLHATLLAAYGISGSFGQNGAIFGQGGTQVLSGIVA
jgi:hypothetical protein